MRLHRCKTVGSQLGYFAFFLLPGTFLVVFGVIFSAQQTFFFLSAKAPHRSHFTLASFFLTVDFPFRHFPIAFLLTTSLLDRRLKTFCRQPVKGWMG
ncbi:hypothetical protein [Desulfuromonas acetoxidans]|uniref:hypothetical protein n=1 Tax=Desulfuromonas acetoxidans TaxID=891 RepID=UPI00159477AD|nr:hypothetical protein [Desulfuromonas acetoxidans]MBF0645055.1 hypothetical protein [Desulfuromonas acetoxidans]